MKFRKRADSPALIAGTIILVTAAVSFFISPLLAIFLALFYVVLCVAACFFPQTNFFGPVISRGSTGKNMVALTFDDGPSRPVTRQVLDLLDRYSVPATFFVTGVNAVSLPEIIKEIVARGHTIGNHSFHHDPFLMLKGSKTIYSEIAAAQEALQKTGVQTMAFRPPVGIVNPQLAPLLEKLNMYCLTFSCRALDRGNRRVKDISRKILDKVKADDIILLHDVPPVRNEDHHVLLAEIEALLSGLRDRGLKVVPLATLIGKNVMID
ncbi:MAG: polysaccharide deacetylase family protein [Deltaproteobacteria bacterium HGW-Deltaproteobacteria-10]|nr:MAG: polysaccharide deacetylase family protein [Deltaproteobacteria bacterium HGW-Deltaproteobacteria-10]